MDRYRRVLERVSRGQSLDAVRERLDLREPAMAAMIESMVRSGHLEEFGCEGDTCSACPFSESCPMGDIQGPRSYMVTAAGRAYLQDDAQPAD